MLNRIIRILSCVSIIFYAAGPAMAAKVGGEFLVSSQALNSSVAQLSGGFVVVWRGEGPGYPIYGQRYNTNAAKLGARFLVTPTSRELVVPNVATLQGGGFVVTWDAPDSSGLGSWIQIFDAGGEKVSGKKRANTFTANDQFRPTAAGLENGSFVVAWTSNNQIIEAESIAVAQRFSADGNRLGSEIRVDTSFPTGGAFHQFPSVAALAGGGFVVAYRGYNGTYARLFRASGNALGNDFQVNPFNESLLQYPVAAGLKDGGFVVIREVFSLVTFDTDIWGRRYDAAGQGVGEEFKVNEATAGNQLDPAVASLSNGGFVVTYSDVASSRLSRGRLYNRRGVAVGGDFTASSALVPTDPRSSVAAQPGGAFVVTHQSTASSQLFVVRGQRFDGK